MAWTMRLSGEEEALLSAQAQAEGRAKQEIARDAVRLYLAHNRRWEEPFLTDDETVDLGGPVTEDEIRATVAERYAMREARDRRHRQ